MSAQQTLPVASAQDQVAEALRSGGRARVTVTSRSTGKHLTVRLACKTKGEDGRWISRARIVGRVGIDEAQAVFADGGDDAFAGWVGTMYLDKGYTNTGRWFTPQAWDDPRGEWYFWAAKNVISWAMGTNPTLEEQASVVLADECSVCGRPLKDPESIARGIGPECFGKRTESTHV
jgi:hypothetical protein